MLHIFLTHTIHWKHVWFNHFYSKNIYSWAYIHQCFSVLRLTTTKAKCKFLQNRSFVLKFALCTRVRFYKFYVCQRYFLFTLKVYFQLGYFSIFSVFSWDSKFATFLLRCSYISKSKIIVKITFCQWKNFHNNWRYNSYENGHFKV